MENRHKGFQIDCGNYKIPAYADMVLLSENELNEICTVKLNRSPTRLVHRIIKKYRIFEGK